MSAPIYNLSDTSTPIVVSFSPLSVPMTAHFVAWTHDDHWLDSRPVLGVLVRHVVNGAGEVTESRTEMAIQYDDSAELCAPHEYAEAGGNCSLISILPGSQRAPTNEEAARVASWGRQLAEMREERRLELLRRQLGVAS